MRLGRVLTGVVCAAGALGGIALAGRRLRDRETERQVASLRNRAETDRGKTVSADDWADLPGPVRSYFSDVLEPGQPYVDGVRIEQVGRLRPGGADSPWKPFTATHHVTVDPPGFYWDATVRYLPFVSVGVRDRFAGDESGASVSLFGVVPVDSAGSSPELLEAELIRYLAEAVWYPTALLPGEGVEWAAIDDETARATVEHGGVTASLTFTFEDDEVRRVHADERYRSVDGGFEPTPWTGHWHDYATHDGVSVPMAGAVTWHPPDGEFQAWQGRVIDIEYR
ncbi:DUF6544 family protein [Halorientalis pallida]|uniref:DUF6544 family protein n=1 Tax=Halorientalis pallida TaxID=2479928 RepID=UPI003C6ECD6E